jgi:hypothetical protein
MLSALCLVTTIRAGMSQGDVPEVLEKKGKK